MGTAAEQRFFDICKKRKYVIRPATQKENIVSHFDFIVQGKRVEVKSMKAPRRGQAPDPNIIYLELRNVEGGDGWLYGRADFIAFEQERGFLIVSRKELVQLVDRMQSRCRSARTSGLFYTMYSRANRRDLVMILPLSALAKLDSRYLMV
jgi:hypothetical protein